MSASLNIPTYSFVDYSPQNPPLEKAVVTCIQRLAESFQKEGGVTAEEIQKAVVCFLDYLKNGGNTVQLQKSIDSGALQLETLKFLGSQLSNYGSAGLSNEAFYASLAIIDSLHVPAHKHSRL